MLRYTHFTTLTQTKADSQCDRRRRAQFRWATVITTFVAIGLLSNQASGQEVEVVDPPTPTVEPAQEKSNAS